MKPVVLILAVCLLHQDVVAQNRPLRPEQRSSHLVPPSIVPQQDSQRTSEAGIFTEIEAAIAEGSVSILETYLAGQVYISISGGESGYFSAKQAAAILQNYFLHRKPVSFSFSRVSEQGPIPYATGRLLFTSKGNRDSAQMYVSLSRHETRWVLAQLNIY
jgi:hypothetical protein